jgi:hypothetical protein
MGEDLISVIDVARQHGRRKATVFKVLKRLSIEPTKRRSPSSKNQMVACITHEEFRLVSIEMQSIASRDDSVTDGCDEADDFVSAELGFFYLIQLEPEFDPGRVKVGFAASMSERLRHLRCSAPFACVIRSWPCRRLWEKTAIESVAADCERLHTEVFRTGSLDEIIGRCERFFAVMPPVQASTPNPASHLTTVASSVSQDSQLTTAIAADEVGH